MLQENESEQIVKKKIKLLTGGKGIYPYSLCNDAHTIKFFGFKLGFWWAHQGSIFIFVLIIFAYSHIMKLVDKHYSDRTMDAGKQ